MFQEPNGIKGVEGDPILGIPSGVTFLMDTTHRFPLDSSINRWRMIDIFFTSVADLCDALGVFKMCHRPLKHLYTLIDAVRHEYPPETVYRNILRVEEFSFTTSFAAQ